MAKLNAGQKRQGNWDVSYNLYTDLLQIYDRLVFSLPKNELTSKKTDHITFMYKKNSDSLLLIEVKNAFEHLGNIENMDKKDIIQTVTKYAQEYA